MYNTRTAITQVDSQNQYAESN